MSKAKEHDEGVRLRLIEAAGRLLREEGPGALSIRRVTSEIDTSTIALYTLFGSKHGLVRALYLEGFERLGAALDAVRFDGDHRSHMAGLGRAYRRSALDNPDFYDLMFGRPIPDFEPSDVDRAESSATFASLVESVAAAIAASALDGNVDDIASTLWAGVHGHVSLELSGQRLTDDPDASFDHLMNALWRGFARPTERRDAACSGASVPHAQATVDGDDGAGDVCGVG